MVRIDQNQFPEVCDSCLDVVAENYPDGADFSAAIMFCVSMGKDMEDHLCDKRETGGEVECSCQCNS